MPERMIGGYYLDIVPDRVALGRYGVSVRRHPGRDLDGAGR